MDIGTLRGVLTAILLVLFLGIVFWAWSRKRRSEFDEAAQLPLDDDQPRAAAADAGRDNDGEGKQ